MARSNSDDGGAPGIDLARETLDDAAAMGSNTHRDEDDPDVRPDACRCRLDCLGHGPCKPCERAGFNTLNKYDIPPADGGKGVPLEDR